eukprot:gnl/MRDRNA2_/MRDRNA2_51605_c0_seq1.p1 gnl/MRDRNA2_/MRDRNA2_51605_c0~~gnl/MRDRNA2_/MRDRNA2_51605_c0_seq1.p1  ORF type:complete len:126 (+),score=16.94 gnl/MRDRNA2_/MRDRNA2_51605_c0_seq1:56-433(+)
MGAKTGKAIDDHLETVKCTPQCTSNCLDPGEENLRRGAPSSDSISAPSKDAVIPAYLQKQANESTGSRSSGQIQDGTPRYKMYVEDSEALNPETELYGTCSQADDERKKIAIANYKLQPQERRLV